MTDLSGSTGELHSTPPGVGRSDNNYRVHDYHKNEHIKLATHADPQPDNVNIYK